MELEEFKGKIFITGILNVKTGLHIGGSKDTFEIGGNDNPIIRDGRGITYIPGSSLKGKLRSLMGRICNQEEVKAIFGKPAEDEPSRPTALIVRDAFPTVAGSLSEIKHENSIDPKTSRANPRPLERVKKGTDFSFELIYNIYDANDEANFSNLLEAMKLLEDDYLGGGGTRGNGKIVFETLNFECRPKAYYTQDGTAITVESTDWRTKSKQMSSKIMSSFSG